MSIREHTCAYVSICQHTLSIKTNCPYSENPIIPRKTAPKLTNDRMRRKELSNHCGQTKKNKKKMRRKELSLSLSLSLFLTHTNLESTSLSHTRTHTPGAKSRRIAYRVCYTDAQIPAIPAIPDCRRAPRSCACHSAPTCVCQHT